MDPINREMMTTVLNWLIDLSLSLSLSVRAWKRRPNPPFQDRKKKNVKKRKALYETLTSHYYILFLSLSLFLPQLRVKRKNKKEKHKPSRNKKECPFHQQGSLNLSHSYLSQKSLHAITERAELFLFLRSERKVRVFIWCGGERNVGAWGLKKEKIWEVHEASKECFVLL